MGKALSTVCYILSGLLLFGAFGMILSITTQPNYIYNNTYVAPMIFSFVVGGLLIIAGIKTSSQGSSQKIQKTRTTPRNKIPMRTTPRTSPVSHEPRQTIIKETIVKEKVRVMYKLPETCNGCKAPINEKVVNWQGYADAVCPYCGFKIKLIEREI